MNDTPHKNNRWRILRSSLIGSSEKSQSSRQSGLRTPFSPKKIKLKQSSTTFHMQALKNKYTTLLEHNNRVLKSKGKQGPLQENNKASPKSILTLNHKRTHSQELSLYNHHINKSIVVKNGFQNQNIDKNELTSYLQNSSGMQQKNKSQQIQAPLLISRIDGYQITQDIKHRISQIKNLKGNKNIQQLLQNFISLMNLWEDQINHQKLKINKLMDQKYKLFISYKQNIFSHFVKNQKQIKKHRLRELIKPYLSRQKYQIGLNRITSQKLLITRQKIIQSNQKNTSVHAISNPWEKSMPGESLKIPTNSIYQINFDNIFGTLNKLKQQLSEDGDKLIKKIHENLKPKQNLKQYDQKQIVNNKKILLNVQENHNIIKFPQENIIIKNKNQDLNGKKSPKKDHFKFQEKGLNLNILSNIQKYKVS